MTRTAEKSHPKFYRKACLANTRIVTQSHYLISQRGTGLLLILRLACTVDRTPRSYSFIACLCFANFRSLLVPQHPSKYSLMKGGKFIAFAVVVAGVAYYAASPTMSASLFRAKHAGLNFAGRRAVVVGGTSGIGQGIAMRLAAANYAVTIVGRDETRGLQIVEEMRAATLSSTAGGSAAGSPGTGIAHAFVPCDASLLSNIHTVTSKYASSHPALDLLVLTQGRGSLEGRNETSEGIDKKLAVHYYGRVAFINDLLPLLRKAPAGKVLSVLSPGVHPPYAAYATDPELRDNYSVKHAGDAGTMYNDIAMDSFSREAGNEGITFIHAAPGMVNTRWGTEMPWWLQILMKPAMWFATTPADCAEVLVDPLFNDELKGGFQLLNQRVEHVPKTSLHDIARETVWAHTKAVLARVSTAAPVTGTELK
jgi:NAD(P)-dependent dehydrogenase (short-subunit alcohol dehydrogenase family)